MREDTYVSPSEIASVWQKCQEQIEKRLESPVWQACLREMQLVSVDGSTVRVRLGQFSDLLNEEPAMLSTLARELRVSLERLVGVQVRVEWIDGETRGDTTISRDDRLELQRESTAQHIYLNPKYTFDTFVEGSSNQLAYAAARSVSENPARAYNPLFLYGGVGLGKTHLMQAIGHGILQRKRKARIVYVSTEQFMNDLIESLGNKRTASFREKYRNVDVLLVDDIQFLINKERTQEEFFHTFNELHSSNRQIVITSDRPPHELSPLEDRLRSRFTQGLIADIQSPDLETREAILRKKVAEQYHINVPLDVIAFIAERFPSSIRDLEGAMIRVIAYASTHALPIDMQTATQALAQILPHIKPTAITIRMIQQRVCEHFRIKIDELVGERRDHRFAFPRQIAMYLAREHTSSSLKQIADEFGGKHHTTVMHACRQIEERYSKDPSTRDNIEILTENLKEPS
ncbi:MAG: chromosomal replication initiator protein DnaA [Proteobacteria bacterium]|nr:chromosomal replication initiator protein DnaA [Pseudomonadota bacterium]